MRIKHRKRRFFGKLLIVSLVVFTSYLIYLDAQIKQRFNGNIWQVPAQIYARPLTLKVGHQVTQNEVKDELKLLGYRRVKEVRGPGEYNSTQSSLTVFRRAFHFPSGFSPAHIINVSWQGQTIHQIRDVALQVDKEQAMLEPWLVSRLVSSSREDRMLISTESAPSELISALTLIEDKDFYQHHGIAPKSIVRALLANLSAGRTVQGASTLTQQLVKNVFLTRERTISRKAKEALMAILIDARYSKDQILEAYLNEVYLGQNGNKAVHGFGLASHYYFDRPLNELGMAEIALLVGMVKGPSNYNPLRNPERATERRNTVLRVLLQNNLLEREQYEALVKSGIPVDRTQTLASGKHPAFMDKVRRELQDILVNPDLRESGVKVFTTLDVNGQIRAEQALVHTTSRLQKKRDVELNGAIMVTDIEQGAIRAIVGGKDTTFRGFNRALNAYRPIGSLAKPVVYLSALERPIDYHLATRVVDLPISLPDANGEQWRPQNADKTHRKEVSLIDGLVQSLNVPTVRLAMDVGLENIAANFKNLGATRPVPLLPSISLGALSLSMLEVSQIYQSIANLGMRRPLHTVEAVLSSNNRLLWQHAPYEEQAVEPSAAYMTTFALHQVTQRGTAKDIGRHFGSVLMAGKTGTTNDYRDSWFAGFDNNVLTTVWLGNDDNESIQLSGAQGAMQVFKAYQQRQEPKSLVRQMPAGVDIAHFDLLSGAPVVPGCANMLSVPAVIDALPKASAFCDVPSELKTQTKDQKSWWERLFGL